MEAMLMKIYLLILMEINHKNNIIFLSYLILYYIMNKLNKNITSCNINTQRWYFLNSIEKSKTGSTPIIRKYYKQIANYYLNGNYNNIYN